MIWWTWLDDLTVLAGSHILEGTPALVAISDSAVVTPSLPRLREGGQMLGSQKSLTSCCRVSLICWVKAVGGKV